MKRIVCAVSAMLIAYPLMSAMMMKEGAERVKIFYTLSDSQGWHAIVKGKITSYSSKDDYDKKDLKGQSQDKSKTTVRLYDTEGIKPGDYLYVINDQNLVTAKMQVKSIFKSLSFGYLLVGYGNFRLSTIGDRVVQRAEDAGSKNSYINKARGDYYDNSGMEGEAIREYMTALKLDRKNPNAHLALGLIYKRQGLEQFALREFQEGYKFKDRIYDNDDTYQLLANLAEIRYKQVYESSLAHKLRADYRGEGMKYCEEALKVYPGSERIHLMLGLFYSRWDEPDDKKARDHFLRVIESDPSQSDAYLALSKLYYKHDSMDKARKYAEKAREADPRNEPAQMWLRKIDEKGQVK